MHYVSILGLAALMACDRVQEHGHDHGPHGHDHGEEEKTAQVTIWADRYEVFMEHQAIVVNSPTRFITHVTDLVTLEPRRRGTVTFLMQLGTEPALEHIEAEPGRAGIYLPELVFGKPGAWKMSLKIEDAVVELGNFQVYETKESAKKAGMPEAPEGISFLKEQQWKVLSKMEPAAKRKVTERVRLPGTVVARVNGKAAVASPFGGRLQAPPGKVLPTLGETVEAGQVLAWVQPAFSDFASKLVEAEAEEIRAKLTLDHSELVLERIKKLVAENAKPERELREAEFAVRTARANLEAAQAFTKAYKQAGAGFVGDQFAVELKSPISGMVQAVSAVVGEHVSTDLAVFAIVDTSKVWIEARVPEFDWARLGESLGALYESPVSKGQFIPVEGKVVFKGVSVDPKSRTVPLVYEVENQQGRLKLGMTLNLQLETKSVDEAVAVPSSAIVDEDGKPIAYVQLSGETFEKRELKLGIRDGGWVQVIDGVAEGDRVVVKEAYAIRLASVSSVIPAHGHSH